MAKKVEKFSMKETLILGAALFAMFFGAGNVIFPPSIGLTAGDNWFIGVVLFILASMGIAFLGILAVLKIKGRFSIVMNRVSPKFTKLLMLTVLLVMGPLYIVPRTGALAYELGLGSIVRGLGGDLSDLPAIAEGLINVSFVGLYVVLILVVIFKPSKIIDIIGKYLTPCLVTILVTIIVMAIINPAGSAASGITTPGEAASEGFKTGYQTMDGISVIVLAPMILNSIRSKRPNIGDKELGKALVASSGIAIIGIAIIYTGMAFVGSQAQIGDLPSYVIDSATGDPILSEFVGYIVDQVMGGFGRVIFGTAVILACYTTAIAFTSTPAIYVAENTWNKKYSYKQWAIVFAVITAVLAVIGVNDLVVLAGPVLEIIFPVVITVYILSLVSNREDISIVFVATMFSALAFGFVAAFAPHVEELQNIVDQIPLGSFGLVWLLPTAAVFFLMLFAFEYMGIDKEEQRKRNKAIKAQKKQGLKK